MMRSTKMMRQNARQTYLIQIRSQLPLTSLSSVDSSPLIHHHQLLQMWTLPLLPLMTKPNWCNALPFGTPLFPKTEAACPQWQDPQDIVKAQAPQVCLLSIWYDDQVTLAWQRVGFFSQSLCCCQARGDSLSWLNRISRGGLFAQVKDTLTKKRYRYCPFFLDHYSWLHCVYLQIVASTAETILAKQAFEKFAT